MQRTSSGDSRVSSRESSFSRVIAWESDGIDRSRNRLPLTPSVLVRLEMLFVLTRHSRSEAVVMCWQVAGYLSRSLADSDLDPSLRSWIAGAISRLAAGSDRCGWLEDQRVVATESL